ncbi:MAG: hypothetical protein HRT89_14165 [Lentisphaeria bacterium]|nr:hypothetical protein [Lentisphaeria bacterium]NQZ69201.1 hypothetical protein [Lentisphaeria bacterium]
MALEVFNNTSAFNVFANLEANSAGLKASMGRLSSGTISVLDDPSGIGISERMRSQIRSSEMARNNVDNGISMLQTSDAWLQKMNDMLGRMHELAVEGADGTKTGTDLSNIQTEFTQLQSEITRVTSRNTAAAKFNGLYLFRGGNGQAVVAGDAVGSGSISIQIGADTGQSVSLVVGDLEVDSTEDIGTVSTYTYSSDNTVSASAHTAVQWGSVIDTNKLSSTSADAIGKIAKAIDHVANTRASLGAQQNRLDQTREGLIGYEDNLRAAESKIRDVDVAQESTEFSRYQILSQISNAMLAQANQLPGAALQLIG